MVSEQTTEGLAALIEKGKAVLRTRKPNPPNVISPYTYVDGRFFSEWRSQTLARLTQIFGARHTYPASFGSLGDRATVAHVYRGLGVLQAALEDVEKGHLETLQEMAAAEVLSDFLDQADHLCQQGYSAPAATLAGAVLENGLRSLAARKGITVKAKDDLSSLNNKIGDKGVYNRLRQKQVAFWIGVRNAAAHGAFDDFTDNDVVDLIKGVRNLLSTVT